MFTNSVVFQRIRAFRACGFARVPHGTIVPRKQIYIVFLFALISGCATTSPESPWDGLTTETNPAVGSIDCGRFPMPSEATDALISYDMAGVNALDAYKVCSEANEAIVDDHAAQIGQLKIARKGLTEAGQAQRRIAAMKQEMLEDERQHHFWQSLGLYAVIIGMGLAL